VDFEDEETWLRHRAKRLRAALRIATEPRVVAILRDLIIDAEKRLEILEANRATPLPDLLTKADGT
jgi:hypothetical protein